MIRAKRSVMAISERMPEVAADFYRDGPTVCAFDLRHYLEAQASAGVLSIPDCDLAANQFLDLAQTGIIKPLLYGTRSAPSADAIGRTVDSAVDMFLSAYQPKSSVKSGSAKKLKAPRPSSRNRSFRARPSL